MRRRAKILAWGIVAMAAGAAAFAGAQQVPSRSPITFYKKASDAPLFGPYYLGAEGHGRGPPQRGTHYRDCEGNCDKVVFKVVFERGCPVLVTPAEENWRNCIDPHKEPGDLRPTRYELTCTAMKHRKQLAFATGERPYEVRFAPFGLPIKVPGDESSMIWESAPSAWYKFTVYVRDPKCEAFDPNIIVTN